MDDSVANPDSIPTDFFGNTVDTSKGCLIFAQSRKPVKDNKGSHVTNGTWVFVNGGKGFVNFNSALSVSDKEVSDQQNQQMTFNGKFYLLEKSTEGSQNIGKVKGKDEVDDKSQSLSQNQWPSWIPSISPKLKPKEAGAVGDGQPQGTLGTGVNQQEQKEISRRQVWKYNSGTGDNLVGIGEGSSNLEWWNSMYPNTKSKGFDLANKLSSFKGTWEEKVSSAS